MNKLYIRPTLVVMGFCLLLLIGAGIFWQLDKINKQNQATLFYRMYDDFFLQNSTTRGIVRCIENDSAILTQNGGLYEECDLDDYLGHFELLKSYMDDGIQPEKNIYTTYSYYMIRAYKNKEVWGYVKDLRSRTGDSTFYKSFEHITTRFMDKDKK